MFSLVPASPPANISSIAFDTTKILVNWTEVPEIDQNGIVTGYEIMYEPLMTFDILHIEYFQVDSTNLSITLMELEEYVEYNISVRAFTSVGPGPYSVGIIRRTFEDGITLSPCAILNVALEMLISTINFPCSLLYTSLSIVPTTPPQNISLTVINTKEIEVNWTEVPEIEQNGIITEYEVMYEPLLTFGVLTTETLVVDSTNLSIILVDLEEYMEYNISVRAYTSVGPGPYSVGIVRRTLEDGEK